MDSSTFRPPRRTIAAIHAMNRIITLNTRGVNLLTSTVTPLPDEPTSSPTFIDLSSTSLTDLVTTVTTSTSSTSTTSTSSTLTPSAETPPLPASSPSSTTQPPPQLTHNVVQQIRPPKALIGGIVGGVVGGLSLIAIILVLCIFWRKQRKRTSKTQILAFTDSRYVHPADSPTRPDLSETTATGILHLSQTLAEIRADHNKPATTALSMKGKSTGPMDIPRREPFNERANLGSQADAINGAETATRTSSDISEEVRLLRVIVRAIEERPRLLTLAGDEASPANSVVDAPPGYEESSRD